jgi:hypothetical protein
MLWIARLSSEMGRPGLMSHPCRCTMPPANTTHATSITRSSLGSRPVASMSMATNGRSFIAMSTEYS